MQDTQESEQRIRAMVLQFAERYGADVTIKFDSSECEGGSHEWLLRGHEHRFTFSRVWLGAVQQGYPYDALSEQPLWEPYGIMVGRAAEWALVIHEFAHAVQATRDVMCNTPDHGGLWSECVRELQREFPLEQHGGVQPMFPPLDFTAMKPVVFVK